MKNWCKIIKTEKFDFLVELDTVEYGDNKDAVYYVINISFSIPEGGKCIVKTYNYGKSALMSEIRNQFKKIDKNSCQDLSKIFI